MSRFADAWNTFHRNHLPISYPLRDLDPACWVRFHSLPKSKRYATAEKERFEVLRRANALTKRVLGEGGNAWLVQAFPLSSKNRDGAIDREFELQLAQQFTFDEVDWQIYAGECHWRSGQFDKLLTRIADDEVDCVFWMSSANGAMFAPYDGGTDLILPSPTDVAALKAEYSEWRSARADGL